MFLVVGDHYPSEERPMKLLRLRRTAPTVRPTRRGRLDGGRLDGGFAGALALPMAALVAVATTLLTGATFAVASAVVPITVPTLVAGWATAVVLAFAAPLAVVRGVVALLERYE